MINVERRSLSEELIDTQRERSKYPPLRIVNSWRKLVEDSTDTGAKRLNGLDGMLTIVALSMMADGDIAIRTAFILAILGGATIGEKIPIFSGPVEFFKEKNAIKKVKEEKDVPVGEIAYLLNGFPDFVDEKEVRLWPKKKMGEESHEHPERYLIMKAVLNNNPETPDVVVEKFMEAQGLALENRRSKINMSEEALRKGVDIAIGVALMVGITYAASFGLGYQAQAGIVGLGDDVVLFGVLAYSFTKEKIKSFFSKYT